MNESVPKMIDTIRSLLEKNFFTILEKTPSACLVVVDTVGQWHVSDFDVVWFNESAKKMFGNVIAGGKVNVQSSEELNKLLENLQLIRQQLLLGQEGFVGPFASTITNSEGKIMRVERYSLYLGEIGASLPTFLILAHGANAL